MSTPSARRGQIALGLLWLIDGVLQFQPYMFGRSLLTGVLLPAAAGQPGFVGMPIRWVAHLIGPHVALFNGLAASMQVLIGIGLLYRPAVRTALTASLIWAGGVWFAGEGLGMLFTGTASPLTGAPGAASLYILAAVICWPPEPSARSRLHRELRPLAGRGARLAWSAIWFGCAALWLLPSNNNPGTIHDAIAGAPSGAHPLSRVLDVVAAATAGRGTTIAIGLAVASALIGLAVLDGSHPRALVAVQIALSTLYWVLGQGLGGVLTGRATDLGTAPLMVLLALMIPPVAHERARARSSRGSPATLRTAASATPE